MNKVTMKMGGLVLGVAMLASEGFAGGVIGPIDHDAGLHCRSFEYDPIIDGNSDIEVHIYNDLGRQVAEVYEYRGDFVSLVKRIGVSRRDSLDHHTEAVYLNRDGSEFKLTLYYEYLFRRSDEQLAYLHVKLRNRVLRTDLACIQE